MLAILEVSKERKKEIRLDKDKFATTTIAVNGLNSTLTQATILLLLFASIHLPTPGETLPGQDCERAVGFLLVCTARLLLISFFFFFFFFPIN